MAAITDNYTDTAATLLEAHVSPGGQTWTKLSSAPNGSLSLGANKIDTASVVGGNPIYRWNVGAISNNITFSHDYVLPIGTPDDFYFSLTVRGASSSGFTGYVGIVSRLSGNLRLAINRDGAGLISGAFPAIDDGLVHTLTLVASGATLQLFVDGVKKLEATDPNYTLQGESRINVHTGIAGLPAGFYLDNASIDVGPAPAAPPPPTPLYSGQLWPRGGGVARLPHPDNPPSLPTAYDDEFVGPMKSKWTLTAPTAPVAYDVDDSWPSWLHVWGRSAVALPNTGLTLTQAVTGFAAGTAFSCTFKTSNGGVQAFATVGVRIERLANGSAGNDFVDFASQFNGGSHQIMLAKRVAGVDTFGVAGTPFLNPGHGDIYLHVQRSTSNVWSFWWSINGRSWFTMTTITLSFAIGEILLQVGPFGQTAPNCEFGIDWFRVNWLTL